MVKDKKEIVEFIRAKSDHPMKLKELAQSLNISKLDYPKFRRVVKDLIAAGELVRLKRGRIGLASELNVRIGRIEVTRSGSGYVIVEGEPDDIYVPPTKLHTALDGDTVLVRITGKIAERRSGQIIRIEERAKRNIVGVFHKGKNFSYVVPDNKKLHRDIIIPQADAHNSKEGEKVVVHLTEWEDPYRNPEGKVVERIGFPGQPGVDMLTVVKSYGFPETFPDEVINEAEVASARLDGGDIRHRLDMTHQCAYTIDPSDAKDFDDAVSVERTETGYRLSVHIADVSFFVQEDSELDREAFSRGNSVYLPGMVIPMLPEVLSNDICSLKPNRKRLAHSAIIEFDRQGKMGKWEIVDTVIKSRARLAYEEVQEFFDGGNGSAGIRRVKDNLIVARELADLLTNRRFAEGSLDFDLPESKIILDKKGQVLELGYKVRLEAHRLVEEFMLAANRAVALEVFRRGQPFLYRVHDKPDLEKLKDFSQLVERLGYTFPVSANMRPILFARFLDRIKDEPEADFINELMLRSMKKAVYQRENIGHFGLAFSHYTHFTSPIRRYPDLIVHRLLRKLDKGRYPVAYARKVVGVIDRASEHCSQTERVAEQAERDAVKVKQVSYMAQHVGDEFDGVISGVTAYGFFVRLDNMGVEGLVRISTIDDDYYLFEEKRYRITGKRTGKAFQLGDKIRVGVLKVDKTANEMDLFVPRAELQRKKKQTSAKKTGSKEKSRRKRRK